MAEAMIAKKPVVATLIPAIDTLFRNEEEAILVPPKDAGLLAAAIRSLAQDPARAQTIARNGHALAGRLCRADRQAEEMERIYRDVIARSEATKQSKIASPPRGSQ